MQAIPNLVLLRHGQSEWNEKNLFTGLNDPDLTSFGEAEAQEAGKFLREGGFKPTFVFTSCLRRARGTAKIVGKKLGFFRYPHASTLSQ